MPTSGPPNDTTVRSRKGERRIARTSDIGFRREAQPPMPMVMPSVSRATASSSRIRLSAIRSSLVEAGFALFHEGLAGLVGDARDLQLVGEPLLVAVALAHIDRVDAVERLLGRAN